MNKWARVAVHIAVLIPLFMPIASLAAVCASILPMGEVQVNVQSVNECTGLILLESIDWVGASIWQFPSNDDIASAWSAGFILPMFLYLFSWGLGRIIRLFFD